nr:hypothetical protein [uncultured Devosia sp.]
MFHTTRPQPAGMAFAFHCDARTQRFFHEHRKLMARAKAFIFSHPRLVMLGEDPVVEHLVSSMGFGPTDLAVVRMASGGRMITAICVPTRIWRNLESKQKLLDIKREARIERTTCILVPQRWLKAEVRSAVARVISQARTTRYSRDQMNLVLVHVQSERISTIVEAANVIPEHDDPIAVVLALAAQGMILVDRSAPLRSETWVSARL